MSHDPVTKYFSKNRISISQLLYKEGNLYKEYKRFPSAKLPAPQDVNASLSSLIIDRESRREFGLKTITLEELSTLLFLGAGITSETNGGEKRRAQPSGGAKYAVELYVVSLQKNNSLARGVYHYNVRKHSLEKLLTEVSEIEESLPSHDEYALSGQFIIFFSFLKNRSFEKYGALAYKLAHMEAGHISQNLYLTTEALGLAGCGLGTSNGHDIDKVLLLDEDIESVFYAYSLGARK